MSSPIRILRIFVALTGVGLFTAVTGCAPEVKPPSPTEKNLKALTVFYGRYVSRHKGQGPSDEAEFKKFIRALPPADFETFGVSPANIDALFVSERDNEPYGIAWKTKGTMPGPTGAPMVIWEKTGVNGKRFVADSLGKIEEIDEATFSQRQGAGKQTK